MKKFLLPLVALSIAFISCSRDNDDVINNPITNPVVQGDLLAEITSNSSLSVGTGRFTYNGNKLQSSASLDGDMSYTYIEHQIRHIRRSKGSMGTWDINYTYNPDGTLKQVDQIHNYEYRSYAPIRTENRKEIATREYTYVDNNTINVKSIAKTYRENSNEVFSIFIAEYTFTINNGNIIKKIEKSQFKEGNDTSSFMSNPITTNIAYTFDDKVNPLHNIKGLPAIAIDFHIIDNKGVFSMHVNKNNILSEKRSDIDGRSIEQTTNQYEYNSKGYPTKLTSTFANGIITDTTVYNYTYK